MTFLKKHFTVHILWAMFAAALTAQHQSKLDSLSKEQFYQYNYRSFDELSSHLPSLFSISSGSIGDFNTFTIFGGTPGQSALLYNGIPIIDPWSGRSDLSLVPVEAAESMSLYAFSNPFGLTGGGVLNINPWRLTETRPLTKIVYRSGGNKFSDLDITFGRHVSSKLTLTTSVQLMNNTEPDSLGYLKKQVLRSSLIFRPSSILNIEYSIIQNRSKINLPYDVSLPGDSISLNLPRLERIRYDHGLLTQMQYFNLKTNVNVIRSAETFQFHEPDSNRRVIPVNSFRLSLTQSPVKQATPYSWGGWIHFRDMNDLADHKVSDHYSTFFFAYSKPFSPRFENNSQAGGHISNNGSLFLTFNQSFSYKTGKNVLVSAGIRKSVREPSMGERFSIPYALNPNGIGIKSQFFDTVAPSPGLSPEETYTTHAAVLISAGRFYLNFSPYFRNTAHTITPVYRDTTLDIKNGAAEKEFGTSINLNVGPYLGFSLHSVNHIRDHAKSDDWNYLITPDIFSNSYLSWNRTFFSGDLLLRCTVGCQYYSYQKHSAPSRTQVIPFEPVTSAFILNAKIDAVVIRNAHVSLSVDNLLDIDHSIFKNIPSNGRTVRFGLSWILLD